MDKRTDKKIIDFVLALIRTEPKVRKIYLFGSYAKNNNKRDSDIDLAIVVEDLPGDDLFDLQVRFLVLASGYDSRIEPHIISVADLETGDPFVQEVLKTGIEIDPHTSYFA